MTNYRTAFFGMMFFAVLTIITGCGQGFTVHVSDVDDEGCYSEDFIMEACHDEVDISEECYDEVYTQEVCETIVLGQDCYVESTEVCEADWYGVFHCYYIDQEVCEPILGTECFLEEVVETVCNDVILGTVSVCTETVVQTDLVCD